MLIAIKLLAYIHILEKYKARYLKRKTSIVLTSYDMKRVKKKNITSRCNSQ